MYSTSTVHLTSLHVYVKVLYLISKLRICLKMLKGVELEML